MLTGLRLRVLDWLWGLCGGKVTSSGACANRKWSVRKVGPVEFTFSVRHTGLPDGYSREELTAMLQMVRRSERAMGWKAPDTGDLS